MNVNKSLRYLTQRVKVHPYILPRMTSSQDVLKSLRRTFQCDTFLIFFSSSHDASCAGKPCHCTCQYLVFFLVVVSRSFSMMWSPLQWYRRRLPSRSLGFFL